jgi:hypothetical protein
LYEVVLVGETRWSAVPLRWGNRQPTRIIPIGLSRAYEDGNRKGSIEVLRGTLKEREEGGVSSEEGGVFWSGGCDERRKEPEGVWDSLGRR